MQGFEFHPQLPSELAQARIDGRPTVPTAEKE
jgi:hypothetical protein